MYGVYGVNSIHDNRKEDIKLRTKIAGKNLAEIADEDNLCTFLLTGPHFVEQDIYHCRTCKLDNKEGVCVVCARTCHEGHDCSFSYRSSFYCDCASKEEFKGCSFREEAEETIYEKDRLGSSGK